MEIFPRRCLVCSNLNPCRDHLDDAQWAELRRNDREIVRIKAAVVRPQLTGDET